MDWNWFYSSSAQSAAAIVGIFAAFIITKIVNNQSDFSNKKGQARRLISNSIRLEDEANTRYFHWYSERTMERALDKLEERLKEDSETLAPRQYYNDIEFPEFIERGNALSAIQKTIEAHKKPWTRGPAIDRALKNAISPKYFRFMSEQLTQKRDLIYKLVNDTKHHIRDLNDFLDIVRNNPESSSLITFSIVCVSLLFFIGVIYPLSFLPLEQGHTISISLSAFWSILFSLQGAWLFAVSLIFNLVLIVFFVINLRMKYPKSEIEVLENYSKIERYSKYFEIMERNAAELKNENG